MSGYQMKRAARFALTPSVVLLFIGMIVPLAMTLWLSFQYYNLLNPAEAGFAGVSNYTYFLSDPAFSQAIINTLLLVGGVLAITVIGGILLALLFDQPMWGRGVVRLLVIAPFFVMPTVSALVWKNMLMHPGYGIFAWIAHKLGLPPVEWLSNSPLLSIVMIVAWQWLPFATLIFLTALQSLDTEQQEAARMDGAGPFDRLIYIILPHLGRAVTVVLLMETIFILAIFAEIFVTTSGGPGYASTNLPFLIYVQALLQFDVGAASAGAIIAVVIANAVAIFAIRLAGKNLTA
ncbi:sorbitol/mannitol transport system permease protein [Mycoplana sp. BE70]|uniref:carbohydrate ABC transporter permease n=1 Tax=Mycoplana sp. BE70 TaxID=2817775 RepID=UPI0028639140|nr:sugar ABC transporter permease [Mycoplana sp. BE70]MDR6759300.1 sorbitol/mannitol transport system permease protein [Mycoplana sp. BE70]